MQQLGLEVLVACDGHMLRIPPKRMPAAAYALDMVSAPSTDTSVVLADINGYTMQGFRRASPEGASPGGGGRLKRIRSVTHLID